MALKMKNFEFLGVHSKFLLLGWVDEKPIEGGGRGGGDCLKKIFKGTWEERGRVVFSRGGGMLIPQCTL